MFFVIAERFSSVLSVARYLYSYIEDARFAENVKNVVERYAGRYLVQVLGKEEGEILLLTCEAMKSYICDDC